ncbi:MAG: GspH/FimT family pseudopilin [Pseudomonadota bacterium]|nr:GspH/FimT family pseudopilin [Pseudomonadota bacterium]
MRQRGFTLIEIIVVIFIISLVTTIILIRTGTLRTQRNISLFAETFYSYLQVCQQQAILQPAVIGVMLERNTYQALYWVTDLEGGHWAPLSRADSFWAPRIIPQDIHLDIVSNSNPQIVIDVSGGMNPVEISIGYSGAAASYRIISSAAGTLTLQGVPR